MSDNYISCHFDDIIKNENVIENRMHDADFTIESIKEANQYNLQQCRMFGLDYVLIDGEYDIDQYCKFWFSLVTEYTQTRIDRPKHTAIRFLFRIFTQKKNAKTLRQISEFKKTSK